MKHSEDRLWSAYMDGELSATEAAEFDASLTPQARRRLAGEMKLENALGEVLRSGGRCPDALWQELRQRVSRQPVPRRSAARQWTVRLAVAAVLAVTLAFAMDAYLNHVPEFLRLDGQVAAAPIELDEQAVRGFLNEHGLEVGIRPLASMKGHSAKRARLLGAREVSYRDEPVVELVYECCDQTTTIVMARTGTPAAAAIERAAVRHKIESVRNVGNAVAGVIGGHPGGHLIEVLTDESGHA